MESTPAPNEKGAPSRDESGIALFMVIAAMTVLSVLVTEFTYIAQVNQRMAFDSLDQIKAHYLAKSGLKLSLLRLKAYQNVKALAGESSLGIPKTILEKIWSFPFFFPFPSDIPGMAMSAKDSIAKFEKASGLEGRFSALIESESNRYNLNAILGPFVPTPSPSASPSPAATASSSSAGASGPTGFDPVAARKNLSDTLWQILNSKFETDRDFADEYRDFRMDDLMDGITAWADRTYERQTTPSQEVIPPKQAPFYSLNELRMVHPMDDRLFELFSPSLTVSTTPGLNCNTIQDDALKVLVPKMTEEERKDFFKHRDNETEDNFFKSADAFFKYLQDNVSDFRGDADEVKRFREGLSQKNIRIVVDETHFKITVEANVNQATRRIEAWVSFASSSSSAASSSSASAEAPPPLSGPGFVDPAAVQTKAGLRITFMRVL